MTIARSSTSHLPSKDLESVSREAESSSVIFTQLSQSFPRAWNAINTTVKSTVVCSEVSQGFGYLTYKQLFPTNANHHWDWELVDTSETNLPFGLAWNTNVSLFGLPVNSSLQSPDCTAMVNRLIFLYAIQSFLKLFLPWGSALLHIFISVAWNLEPLQT